MEILTVVIKGFITTIGFLHQHALWIVGFYYLLFLSHVPMKRVSISKALTVPTIYVVIGLVAAILLAAQAASDDCHPSHGIPCGQAPDFTFGLFLGMFKGVIVFAQLFAIPAFRAHIKKEVIE